MAFSNCPYVYYCLSNTGNPLWDDVFVRITTGFGTSYNGRTYYSGQTNGYFIYYNSGLTQWCLSTTLGGSCDLFGPTLSSSNCPDLLSEYLSPEVCPTPTPTPTNNCTVLDFQAYFDCEISPTPTTTPTVTPTPTQTPTPSSFLCFSAAVDSSMTAYTPTPTVTPTITPTSSEPIVRPCNYSGDVTFITIDTYLQCPFSKQFQDCENGFMYYTSNVITGSPQQYEIYVAEVDGQIKCISYVGINTNNFGVNDITLSGSPIGYSNLGGCSLCAVSSTPTPTPTLTPTPTPSPIPCFCYELIAGESTIFNYVDCDGISSTATTSSYVPVYVCSRTTVTTTSTGIYSINMRGQCTTGPFVPPACPTITCTCYTVSNDTSTVCMVVYYDCNNDIQFIGVEPYSESVNFCSLTIPYINKLDKTNITINTFNACVGGVCV